MFSFYLIVFVSRVIVVMVCIGSKFITPPVDVKLMLCCRALQINFKVFVK